MKSKFLLLYSWFVRTALFFLPDMAITMKFRGFLYGLGMKKCGKNFQVTADAWLKDLGNLEFGDNCFIGNSTIIMGSGTILVEDDVLIGPQSIIISGNHSFENGSFRNGKNDTGDVIIKNGSWIAAHCTVTKGAILPEGSVLAANSVLNKAFEQPESVYAGVPAHFIKSVTK